MTWPTDHAPFPFIWLDVALVHFLSALPLAFAIATFLRGRASAPRLMAVALLTLVATASLFAVTSSSDVTFLSPSLLAAGYFLRALLSLGAAAAAALTITALASTSWFPGSRLGTHYPEAPPRHATQPPSPAPMFLLGSIVLFLLPSIYIHARSRHDADRVAGLLEQSRLGEALTLAQRLLVLSPQAESRGTSLRHLAADTSETVRAIKARVKNPLSPQATDQARQDRARELAILGRTPEALAVLASSPSLAASPDAHNLRGTIHEARGEWELGLDSYSRAKLALQPAPATFERTGGLIRASTGLAYCQRKLGRYADAEAAYLDLLSLSPTAETHFLLARFYDDTEQTAKAHLHARQAMQLAPDRYQFEGQRLIDNLTSRHFGCLSVFQSSSESGTR